MALHVQYTHISVKREYTHRGIIEQSVWYTDAKHYTTITTQV